MLNYSIPSYHFFISDHEGNSNVGDPTTTLCSAMLRLSYFTRTHRVNWTVIAQHLPRRRIVIKYPVQFKKPVLHKARNQENASSNRYFYNPEVLSSILIVRVTCSFTSFYFYPYIRVTNLLITGKKRVRSEPIYLQLN